jgi:hypothetical protein
MDDTKTNRTRRSILLVHGSDFKPPADVFLDEALTALRAGIERDYPDKVELFDALDIDLAYYGDLGNKLLREHGKHYDEELDIGDRRNALETLRKIPQRKRFGLRQYDSLRGKSAIPEAVADVVSPLFGMLGLTSLLVSMVAKDFAVYLSGNTEFTEQVRARVRDKLCEMLNRGDQLLLMTHGTGCFIAYDVLWQLSHDEQFRADYSGAKVDLWMTLGSPISDDKLRKRLLGAGRRAKRRCGRRLESHDARAPDQFDQRSPCLQSHAALRQIQPALFPGLFHSPESRKNRGGVARDHERRRLNQMHFFLI